MPAGGATPEAVVTPPPDGYDGWLVLVVVALAAVGWALLH